MKIVRKEKRDTRTNYNPLLVTRVSNQGKQIIWTDILKYLFSFSLIGFGFHAEPEVGLLFVAGFELSIIIILTNMIRSGLLRNLVSGLLHLMFNFQILILYFGGTYLSLIMVTNIDSLEALSGKMRIYLTYASVILLFSFLPVHSWKCSLVIKYKILSILLAAELISVMIFGSSFSPLFAYGELITQEINNKKRRMEIQDAEDMTHIFYRDSIVGEVYGKPDDLVKQPNIILLFAEGLSQKVISDERHIMPHVAQYQSKSLNFINYYNHTFATYRGIIGQLYSGYQLENKDQNHLTSLQSFLSEEGYHTVFINTEPNNSVFLSYLKSFEFDQVESAPGDEYEGANGSMSDKEAFEKLFEVAMKEKQENSPFFISMYSFGTHVSLDSPDEVFKDGDNAELNKFYNLDYQFNSFMEKFHESELAKDTIIVFTTDHATYKDNYYKETFSDHEQGNAMIDRIPLFIYYKGINPEEIDVEGRNSLGLTPTVLDFLDLSGPNYFLGVSLFASRDGAITTTVDNLNTIFTASNNYISTERGELRMLIGDEEEITNALVNKYYIAKEQFPQG